MSTSRSDDEDKSSGLPALSDSDGEDEIEELKEPESMSLLWKNPATALAFCLRSGLHALPAFCAAGHRWKPELTPTKGLLVCKEMEKHEVMNVETGVAKTSRMFCTSPKTSWRNFDGTFVSKLPNVLSPWKLVRFLYWFSQRLPQEQLARYAQLKPKSTANACEVVRTDLTKHMLATQKDYQADLGSGETALIADVTYITKRPTIAKKGPAGRKTVGHKTCIMGITELDLSTTPRVCTGRTVLKIIRRENRRCVEKVIRKYARPGAHVWTDSHTAYSWLGKGAREGELSSSSGFRHSHVIHKKKESTKARFQLTLSQDFKNKEVSPSHKSDKDQTPELWLFLGEVR